MTGFKSAISLICLLALTGCGTMNSAPSYSARDKNAMAFAVMAQAADIGTTAYAFSQGGYSEANPMFGEADSNSELLTAMLSTKIILIGGGYLAGQIWPEHRDVIWYSVGGVGAAFTGWNTYQIIK